MAYTKIHPIKTTLNLAIEYICNPSKTDDKIYISSYACSPETADIDFMYTLDHCRENAPNLAYHLIQAFRPDEVNYEEAHQIGKELVDEILEGKYSYILTTHIDKGHIHNHILFCAADNINHNKYHDCKQSYYRIRSTSDKLCKEHNLSIIIPDGQRGKSYWEWYSNQTKFSWKTEMRKDINESIRLSSNYDEFLQLMLSKGYEIKGEEIGEDKAKYISFRPPEKERFIRGSAKSLGKEYTKERIKERIETRQERNKKITPKDYTLRQLVDTSAEPFQNNLGLMQWAKIQNLKIVSQTYLETDSIQDLKQQIALKSEIRSSSKEQIVLLDHRLKELGEILKYVNQYRNNRKFHLAYSKSKNPDAYFRKHESNLLLYYGAENYLKQTKIDLQYIKIQKMNTEYEALEAKRASLMSTYKTCDKDLKILNKKLANLKTFLGQKEMEDKTPHNKQTTEL